MLSKAAHARDAHAHRAASAGSRRQVATSRPSWPRRSRTTPARSASRPSATPSPPPTRSCSSSGRASPRPPTNTASRCSRGPCWGGAHEAAPRRPGHAGVRARRRPRSEPPADAPAHTRRAGLAPDRAHPPLRDRRRRRARRAVRAAPPRVRGLHRLRSLADLHRGLHPRPRPAAVREHAHGGVGDRAPDDGAAGGRPPHHPPGRQRGRRRTSSSSAARARRARSTSSSACSTSTPRPSSSSAPTSTTPTSCRGGSRAPTSSRSPRTPTGASTSPGSRPSCAGYADRPLKVGSFSAASNVTGIVSDVDALARVLRRHGALACFDYAAAGPYLPIDMAGQGRGVPLPAQVPRRPGTPAC